MVDDVISDGKGTVVSTTAVGALADPNPLHVLGLDVQTLVGNANYQMLPTDRYVVTSVGFTASRTWTLPAASSVSAGLEITVADTFGAIPGFDTLTISPAGADTIDHVAADLEIDTIYGYRTVRSDGVSNWTVLASSPVPSDGWTTDTNTWTYATGNSFLINGADATGYLPKGTKVSYNDGTVDYGHVYSASYSGGNTTVILIPTDDYFIANAALTAPRYSYADSPQGFPTKFNYTPTFTGYSANPTSLAYQYSIGGGLCTCIARDGANGTSNAATITATLPIPAATVTNGAWVGMARFVDGGAAISAVPGFGSVASGATTMAFGATMTATGGFTATLGKRIVSCTVVYPI